MRNTNWQISNPAHVFCLTNSVMVDSIFDISNMGKPVFFAYSQQLKTNEKGYSREMTQSKYMIGNKEKYFIEN